MQNDFFWIDSKRNIKKSYEDLIEDLNESVYTNSIIKNDNTYEVFLKILLNLVHEIDSVIVDADISGTELKSFEIEEEDLQEKVSIKTPKKIGYEDVKKKLQEKESTSTISLFTSGTTGKPKKVAHKISNLTRNVKMADRYESNVWAFAYNPTHFAGMQVFFQAFMNKNLMVNIFDASPSDIEDILINDEITHISATPTFYRMLTPSLKEQNNRIKHVTSGGEKFDKLIKEKLSRLFVNARFHNIYASTEAGSLLTSNEDTFSIPKKFADKIRISEANELLIHQSLLGMSEKLKLQGDWYHTGDVIERIDDKHFKIKGRESDVLNVGGYNVDPTEVEELIRKNSYVLDVVVKGRPNRILGNIIVSQIVKDDKISKAELQKELLSSLNSELQSYKVPRIFTFVDSIDKSRTGKTIRK